MVTTRLPGGVVWSNRILFLVSVVSFLSCYFFYYQPKLKQAEEREELTCTLVGITTYNSTCKGGRNVCSGGRSSFSCSEEKEFSCVRAVLTWSFGSGNDTRDVLYSGELVGTNLTCWLSEGSLSFDSVGSTLTGVKGLLGFLGVITCLTLLSVLMTLRKSITKVSEEKKVELVQLPASPVAPPGGPQLT